MKPMHVHPAASIAWETFLPYSESTDCGNGCGERDARVAHAKACCVPETVTSVSASCTR
jgi:hypothetical protein